MCVENATVSDSLISKKDGFGGEFVYSNLTLQLGESHSIESAFRRAVSQQ